MGARDEAGAAAAYPRDTGEHVDANVDPRIPAEHVVGVSNCSAGTPVKYGVGYLTPQRAAYLSRMSEQAKTGLQSVRRWEELGWKDGVSGGGDHPDAYYDGSAVLFNAWEGGNGPSDCEPLMVVAPQTTKTYSVAAIFETSLELL